MLVEKLLGLQGLYGGKVKVLGVVGYYYLAAGV